MSDICDQLEAAANELGMTVYNICHRNAGWGIQWYESARRKADDWESGLIVYKYHPSFEEMVNAELERIGRLERLKP